MYVLFFINEYIPESNVVVDLEFWKLEGLFVNTDKLFSHDRMINRDWDFSLIQVNFYWFLLHCKFIIWLINSEI